MSSTSPSVSTRRPPRDRDPTGSSASVKLKNRWRAAADEARMRLIALLSIGPPWQRAQMPFFDGGVKGASTRNVRPRCSAAVMPGGSSGGGPPAANFLSAGEEKN